MGIQQLQPKVDLTTIYLSICKKHSHRKTLYEDHFSLEQDTLSLLLFVVLLLWCVVNACSWSYLKENKPKLPYMHEDTCHLAFMQNTKCPLQCICITTCVTHTLYTMCYSYTTPCVHHAPCYLSSHATFHFVKCMLAMWQ